MRLRNNNNTNRTRHLALIFLTIALLDELVWGVLDPSWPLIQQDLALSYGHIGLLLSVPNIVSSLIEPALGIWADMGYRRWLMLGGGLGFAIALAILALSSTFGWLLLGLTLLGPSSAGFVTVAQATLMDLAPDRHERNMARWTLAGSIGIAVGPLVLVGAIALNQSWRTVLILLSLLAGLMLGLLWKAPLAQASSNHHPSFGQGVRDAIASLKRPDVIRWLTLLQFSDLMLDVFQSFIALYFVDVVGIPPAKASVALSIWLGFGLLGDFLLIPLLTRIRGLTYLKVSVILVLLIYPLFLTVPNLDSKYILLGGLGLLNAGWYSILQGRLYTSMTGQSGAVMTLSTLFGLAGSLVPLLLGFMALRAGLETTMWVMMAAPVALLLGLWRQ